MKLVLTTLLSLTCMMAFGDLPKPTDFRLPARETPSTKLDQQKFEKVRTQLFKRLRATPPKLRNVR